MIMGAYGRSGKKAIIAGIAGFVLLLAVLSASGYIASEAHHECHGSECEVCDHLRLCCRLLSSVGLGMCSVACVFIPVTIERITNSCGVREAVAATPVSRKVRLND